MILLHRYKLGEHSVQTFCLSSYKEFEIVVEFNGDESMNSDSLPVALTSTKTMRLPATAYNGDASVFKQKLIESLSKCREEYPLMK